MFAFRLRNKYHVNVYDNFDPMKLYLLIYHGNTISYPYVHSLYMKFERILPVLLQKKKKRKKEEKM